MVHQTSKRDQFLMKQRPDFEVAHSNLMNRNPVPSLNACLSELCEEQHIVAQATTEDRAAVSTPATVAYAARRDMRVVQCYSRKAFSHFPRVCPTKHYNYCRKQGHNISVCPIRPNRKRNTAYHTSTSAYSFATLPATSQVVPNPAFAPLPNRPHSLMVQQVINFAFSNFGQFLLRPGSLTPGLSNIK